MKYISYPKLEVAIFAAVLIGFCPETRGQCEQAKLVASDGTTDDRFGTGVALSSDGHIALIGAYTDDHNGDHAGAAYVFNLKGDSWVEIQKLEPNDVGSAKQFGRSVAITPDGSVAVIGAWADDEGGWLAGAAYVFVNEGSVWTQQGKLIASDASNQDNFGISVDISADGKTVIVGSYRYSEQFFMAGAAYLYRFDDSSQKWNELIMLTASDANASDQFGVDVAISANGHTALVGAHKADGFSEDKGAAYVFIEISDGLWLEQAKLFAPGGGIGHSVAISDDGLKALLGAPSGGSGRALFFTQSGGSWEYHSTLLPIDGGINHYFGKSLALSLDGQSAVIAAKGDSDGGHNAGSAYYFSIEPHAKQWVQHRKFFSSDIAVRDALGMSTAIAGSTILVSSMKDTNEGGEEAGAAYIFDVEEEITDCNNNTVNDDCEIVSGVDYDCNSNGIPDDCDIDDDNTGVPDDCEAIGDLNGNGSVDAGDLYRLLNRWGPCADCNSCPADFNDDCTVNTSDLLILLSFLSHGS